MYDMIFLMTGIYNMIKYAQAQHLSEMHAHES